jgi:two-component system, OmpR family, sensor histidine kinase BaeS
MSFSEGDERFLVARLTRAAIIGGLVAGAVALLLALYLAHRLIQPVRLLTAAAQRLADGDLSQRVAIVGKDELAELGQTFNQMADSLQRAQKSRRALTADIAHELRTPLAVQRANLEALQDGIYSLTPDNLEPVIEQHRLLNRLVEDLHLLALADGGQLQMELAPTDLDALVVRMVERFKPQADAQSVSLVHQIQPNLARFLLDPMRFEQVLGNLLSNALRFTPPGGEIHVLLEFDSQQVRLVVHDTGPGIPEDALPYIFDRFYRADRARGRGEGGSGLGLAIARRIVVAHGGVLTAANHPLGGAVFTIQLSPRHD